MCVSCSQAVLVCHYPLYTATVLDEGELEEVEEEEEEDQTGGDEDDGHDGDGEQSDAREGEEEEVDEAKLLAMQAELGRLQRTMQMLQALAEGAEGMDPAEAMAELERLLPDGVEGLVASTGPTASAPVPRAAPSGYRPGASSTMVAARPPPVAAAAGSPAALGSGVLRASGGPPQSARAVGEGPPSASRGPPPPPGGAIGARLQAPPGTIVSGDAEQVQLALMQLRQLEEQNARLEQLREVTQRAYTSQGAGDGDEDEDEDPEAVEAHLAVLMTQLEVRGPFFCVQGWLHVAVVAAVAAVSG